MDKSTISANDPPARPGYVTLRASLLARQSSLEAAGAARQNGKPSVATACPPMLAAPDPPATESAAKLARLVRTFRSLIDLPDPGSLEVMLGAYAGNRMTGSPVWLLLVGPPSGGKGEVIAPFEGLPFTHEADKVTEAALLSGTPKDGRSSDATGGLLREVGDFGIFVMKDFTSVFTQNRDERGKALSALRHCYDGKYPRPIGGEGGKTLVWKGKLGIIGGVTEAIDIEHAVMAKLGPRFLLFRLPDADEVKQAEQAYDTTEVADGIRADLLAEVGGFIQSCDFNAGMAAPSAGDRDWMVALSTLSVRCRSHVERHPYTREIEQIPQPEGPGRMMRALRQLWAGLAVIGVSPPRRRELVRKVALDSIPPLRRMGLEYLAAPGVREASLSDIAKTCCYAQQTIRRALQDLACHGIVESRRASGKGEAEFWSIAERRKPVCKLLGIRPAAGGLRAAPFTVNRRVSTVGERE
ncbi:MAG TPA: hypothetical protein VKR61_26095 [Bryobacteraceae bacterium]|nr:hypothetical protein [Bryobacteraceae bacterium]